MKARNRDEWYGYNRTIDRMIGGAIITAILGLIKLAAWLMGRA